MPVPEHSAAERAWVGVDLGTQSVRALAVDDRGRTLAAASRTLRSHRDGRRHEQDPQSWWDQVADALREVCAGLGGVPVAGVATCATSGTILLADAGGRPLTPGVMYDDGRAPKEVLDRVSEAGQQTWSRLGYRMQATWALPKLVQVVSELGPLPRGARLMHQGDVIAERLVGDHVATDSSQALKSGLDLETLRWPVEVFEELGLPVTLLPEAVLPGATLGVVCAAAAELTGLAVGTPVVAGLTDGRRAGPR